jgi:beta-N-acetylhexosaminidase
MPSSLSSWFLRDVLRDKIGFNGLVITDDLMMIGATSWLGVLAHTAKQAIIAGNDIIMFSHTPVLFDPLWTHLFNSMRDEEDFRRIVRIAARRTLELKLRYLRGSNSVPYIPDLTRVAAEIPDPEATAFFLDLAARSVTIVRPDPPDSIFPLTRENTGRVLLAGKYGDFFRFGRTAFPGAVEYRYSGAGDASVLISMARNADTVIFCLSDGSDLRLLRNIQQMGRKVIVLSILSPFLVENLHWVDGAVAVYSYAPESFAAGFSAMLGRIPAQGILPYEL